LVLALRAHLEIEQIFLKMTIHTFLQSNFQTALMFLKKFAPIFVES